MISFDKVVTKYDKEYFIYLSILVLHDNTYMTVWLNKKTKIGYGHYEYCFGDFDFNLSTLETTLDFIANKVSDGYVRCSKCHKWIKMEDAKTTCPAGCYCNDCYGDKEINEEREFLRNLD